MIKENCADLNFEEPSVNDWIMADFKAGDNVLVFAKDTKHAEELQDSFCEYARKEGIQLIPSGTSLVFESQKIHFIDRSWATKFSDYQSHVDASQ